MIIPIITEIIAAIKTAAAEMSLIHFIFSLDSVEYKSHSFSIALLTSSRESTTPEMIKMANHSMKLISNKNATKRTAMKQINCSVKFRSDKKADLNPRNAFLKPSISRALIY